MITLKRLAAVCLAVGLAAGTALIAAQRATGSAAASATLTAADIIEIQQLAVRYTYALDSGAMGGEMFAELFAPDGTFTIPGRSPITGREQLVALGRGQASNLPRRFIVNHIVDPVADGATGRVYVVEVDLPVNGEGGRLSAIGGIYEDVYRKTTTGWRFKSRQFVASKAAVRPAASASNIAKPPPAAPGAAAGATAGTASRAASAPSPVGAGVKPLTPSDYIAIQNLVARYGYAVDTGAPEGTGAAYAALFTPDGTFEGPGVADGTAGTAKLAALARIVPGSEPRRGPNTVSHFLTNHLIEPTSDGAVGKVYYLIVAFGENGQPHTITLGGEYEDAYARTADGWKFKSRRFHRGRGDIATAWKWMPSRVPVRPAPQDASTTGPLTSMDYLEIRRLVSFYAYGLDGGADEGGVYADNFAPGGALFGRVQSRDEMKTLASREPHGPQFTRHFLANVLIEPGASGPVGKQYLAVIDISEEGKESAIYLGGRYDDEYVKTPQGWKFKTRSLTRANAPAAPAAPAGGRGRAQQPPQQPQQR